MTTCNLINIGAGNGLLPDGTKPLDEPMSLIIYSVIWKAHENNLKRNTHEFIPQQVLGY